ncbi:MAG: terminase small subunit [Bacillota bacterium]
MQKNLNERQIKFCEYYVVSCNAADSVRKAGYKCKNPAAYGYRLLQTPHIQAYLDTLLTAAADKRIAQANEILEFYTQLMRGDFDASPDVKFSDRLKAADALAKIFGLFSERFGIGDKKPVTIVDDIQ